MDSSLIPLKKTALHALHRSFGARLVEFAGHEMPLHYKDGILTEHLWVRHHVGLFDVSHMGQAFLIADSHEAVAMALEALVPGDILGLAPGRLRYTQLLTSGGGIIDDLMVTRPLESDLDGRLLLVVNASRRDIDYGWLRESLPLGVELLPIEGRSLLALQGPRAEYVLGGYCSAVLEMPFMSSLVTTFLGVGVRISRCGYTGEDGFEISVPDSHAVEIAEFLLKDSEVKLIGLGARDSLRLEAGLCLYGHDIDETTSPVEADLVWSIGKRRKEQGGFIGESRVLKEIAQGPVRRRVGLKIEGRLPAREGCVIQTPLGKTVGRVTSGGFAPTVNGPIAMGYVDHAFSEIGTPLMVMVRGKALSATIIKMPFVPNKYKR